MWLGGKADPPGIVLEIEIDHKNKWYMHKPESVLENERHKIPWDSEIETDHLDPTRRLDLMVIIKKQNLSHNELCCPCRSQSNN